MISDFRNRLRKQPIKSGASADAQPGDGQPDPTAALMAWEQAIPDVLYETRSQVTPVEAEWREKIYQQLLKVMDLSLLDALEQVEAARQIRDICQRLLEERPGTGEYRQPSADHQADHRRSARPRAAGTAVGRP